MPENPSPMRRNHRAPMSLVHPFALIVLVVTLATAGQAQPTITTDHLPTANIGVSYSTQLAATGGTQPYTWSITPALFAGLSLNPNTGVISGTPQTTGVASYTVTVHDGGAVPGSLQLWMYVYDPLDVNRDWVVDMVDVQKVVNIIISIAFLEYPAQGDVNLDSLINVQDIQAIVNKIHNP